MVSTRPEMRKCARPHVLNSLELDKLVAEHLHTTNPCRACASEGLETSYKAKRSSRPESLSALVPLLIQSITTIVLRGITREALHGSVQNGDE